MTTIFIRTYARVEMVLCGEKSDNVCTHFVTIIQRLSVAYIGPKSRTERPRKTKIGTEVAHVTRDSDTTFKLKRSTRPLYSLRP